MKPCMKCGGTERDNSGECRPCKSKRMAKWYIANRERNLLVSARYRIANPDKARARLAKWRKENPEKAKAANNRDYAKNKCKRKAYAAKYRAEHSEEQRIASVKYRAANPEKTRAATAKWYAENPERRRVYERNRRARKKAIGGKLSSGLVKVLFKRQKGKCVCCKKSLEDNYHLDHIMPLALGGANEDWNMQLLRASCNSKKHAKHPVDYMREKGFLI